jgi:hypothetical protein
MPASLVSSSSLVFEIGVNASLKVFLNDVQMTPVGCSADDCSVWDFKDALAELERTSDVKSVCTSASHAVLQ